MSHLFNAILLTNRRFENILKIKNGHFNAHFQTKPSQTKPIFLCAKNLLLVLGLLFCSKNMVFSQVSGTIYQDYNQNATQEIGAMPSEKGIAGVKAYAFSSANVAIDSSTTAANGTYSMPNATGMVRVEFRYPNFYFPTYGSAINNTIRIVSAPAANVNLGLHLPGKYCNADPEILVNCYVFGDQITGPYKDNEVLLSFPYLAGAPASVNTAIVDYTLPATHAYTVTAKELGPTWGIGFRKTTSEIFTGAAVKRHMSAGPGGNGAIYKMGYSPLTSPTLFVTLPTGVDPHDSPNWDTDYKTISGEPYVNTHDAVGKLGIGDLEIIEDPSNPANDKLFAINLYDKKLYKINANTGAIDASYSGFLSLTGATQGCPTVDVRSFGLGKRNGKLYVGLVCTGESTNTWPGTGNGTWDVGEPFRDNGNGGGTADNNIRDGGEFFKDIGVADRSALRAYVYELDPNTGAVASAPSVEYNLNLKRGCVGNGNSAELWSPGPSEQECDTSGYRSARWNPWSPTFRTVGLNSPENRFVFPQPALSDIEFDCDDNMIISMWDRAGFQGGNQTMSEPGSAVRFQGQTGGDIHIASYISGINWAFENNGTSGAITTGGANDAVGPGGGEYFYEDGFPLWQGSAPPFVDFMPDPNSQHMQVVIGGLTYVPGSGEILAAVFDPIPVSGNFEDQGIHIYDISNGKLKRAYRVVDGSPVGGLPVGPSAKDAGLGDLEALCDAEPIELGNYIWKDTDKDGIQDPNEMALQNVNVTLYNQNGQKVGTTTTNSNGQYWFTNANVDTTGNNGATSFTGLHFGQKYYVVVGEGQVSGDTLVIGTDKYVITTPDVNSGVGNDENDSDAVPLATSLPGALAALSGYPSYRATAGGSGGNKQMFDFGFKTPECSTPLPPIKICAGDEYILTADALATANFQWFKNGVAISGATMNTYTVTMVGVYHFDATDAGGCPVGQCCPITFEQSGVCCPVKVCLPVATVKH
jgi:hypothetical protein